jgi:hypothetical protein
MQRDIDRIIERLAAEIPGIYVTQLQVKHPGNDDDGLWFVQLPERDGTVQLESTSGKCPFLIESDFNHERLDAKDVEEAVAKVKHLLASTY